MCGVSSTVNHDRNGQRTGRLVLLLALVGLALGSGAGCVTTSSVEPPDPIKRAQATRDVGIDHLQQGRTAMAIRKLTEARNLDPSDPVTRMTLGEAYRRKGHLKDAERLLLDSLRLQPDKTDFNRQETLLNLGALYIQMERYEEARSRCQELVEDPTFSSPWRALTNRGWAEYKLGRIETAKRTFKEALDFHPQFGPAHLNLGIIEKEQKQWLPALRHFQLAIDGMALSPNAVAQANYHIAEIYVALGKRDKAIAYFEVAMNQSPYGSWGTQSKSYLELLR